MISTLRRSKAFHEGSPTSNLDSALRTASLILWSEKTTSSKDSTPAAVVSLGWYSIHTGAASHWAAATSAAMFSAALPQGVMVLSLFGHPDHHLATSGYGGPSQRPEGPATGRCSHAHAHPLAECSSRGSCIIGYNSLYSGSN